MKMTKIAFRADKETAAHVDKLTRETGLSKSAVVRLSLEAYLNGERGLESVKRRAL